MSVKIMVHDGDLAPVNEFYAECGYTPGADSADTIIIAVWGGNIVGAVRLVTEHGILVLRGMEVEKLQQHRGTGTEMLQEFNRVLAGRECFCIPYVHLEGFYSRFGFRPVWETDAPEHLQERLIGYRRRNPAKAYLIMRKEGRQ